MEEEYKVIELLIDVDMEKIFPNCAIDDSEIHEFNDETVDEKEERNKDSLDNKFIIFDDISLKSQGVQLINEQLRV